MQSAYAHANCTVLCKLRVSCNVPDVLILSLKTPKHAERRLICILCDWQEKYSQISEVILNALKLHTPGMEIPWWRDFPQEQGSAPLHQTPVWTTAVFPPFCSVEHCRKECWIQQLCFHCKLVQDIPYSWAKQLAVGSRTCHCSNGEAGSSVDCP